MIIRYKEIKKIKFDESQYLKTGFSKIDKDTVGIGKGQYTLVFGTRGGGKSTFLYNLTANFTQSKYKGIICSFEMPNARTRYWLNLIVAGKDNLKKIVTSTGKEIYEVKNDFIDEKIDTWIDDKVVIDDNETFDCVKVYETIKDFVEKNTAIDYVILDNLMKLDIKGITADKWQAQSRLVLGLQKLAQQKNIALILVAHPNKIKTCPRIEDVGGSGDIINAADNVYILHRVNDDFCLRAEEYFGEDTIKDFRQFNNIVEIAKNRDFGIEKFCGLFFEPIAKRFTNFIGENIKYGWETQSKQSTMTNLVVVNDDELDNIF